MTDVQVRLLCLWEGVGVGVGLGGGGRAVKPLPLASEASHTWAFGPFHFIHLQWTRAVPVWAIQSP